MATQTPPAAAFETADHYLRLASCVSDYMALTPKRFRLVHHLCTALPVGASILEIGVCYGHTAIMLASFAKRLRGRYTGIDRWNDTSPSSRRDVQNTFDGLGLSDHATLIEGDSRVVPWAQFPLDFLLIDGGHDEECVSSDIARFLPFVTPGGFVAFDDYDAEWDPRSPCRAVKKFADLVCTPDRWREAGFVLERKPDWNTVDSGLKAWKRIPVMAAAAQFAKEEEFSDAELEFATRMEFTHRSAELLSLYDQIVLRKAIQLLQVKLGGGAKELAKRMGMSRKSIYVWKRGEITYHSAHRVWSMLEDVWREHYKVAA